MQVRGARARVPENSAGGVRGAERRVFGCREMEKANAIAASSPISPAGGIVARRAEEEWAWRAEAIETGREQQRQESVIQRKNNYTAAMQQREGVGRAICQGVARATGG
jgi:hypothetical protein